ncbi:ubiquinone biosynthesis methyltransferase UbiE [Clostridiales bacterium PH28_bin88]|nr:ubiquinone biosynthesis methyltransferase UbiE [Clostridiales bacterium PH28_bin88]
MENYRSKEEYVHAVFSAIAHRYDLMNTLISFNRHKAWRSFAVQQAGLKPGGSGLDVCCGTGMFAMEIAKVVGPGGRVTGLDFCENMLEVADRNLKGTRYQPIIDLVQGNAMDLPFPDNAFDCATIGFALRNVPDIEQVVREMLRVVRPGGRVISLELAKPSAPFFKQLYYLYFDGIVPLMGRLGIGRFGPYNWLPKSLKLFPHQEEIRQLFARLGMEDARCYELTGGVVAVHVGTKPGGEADGL